MGYQTLLYYGASGSTAATQITNAKDVEYSIDPERGNTTVRGDGTSVPIITAKVTGLKPTITFTYQDKASDTTLAALLAHSFSSNHSFGNQRRWRLGLSRARRLDYGCWWISGGLAFARGWRGDQHGAVEHTGGTREL